MRGWKKNPHSGDHISHLFWTNWFELKITLNPAFLNIAGNKGSSNHSVQESTLAVDKKFWKDFEVPFIDEITLSNTYKLLIFDKKSFVFLL